MASIAKREDGKYRARYRDSGGREHARHFARKGDAQRWLDEATAALVTGTHVDPRKGRTMVSVAAEAWAAASLDWKASTRSRNRSILDGHVLPRWGSLQLAQVQPEDVQKWVAGLSRSGLAPRTVRKDYFVLNGLMKYAVHPMRALAVAPTVGIVLPAAGSTGDDENEQHDDVSTERRYLSGSEVEALAAARVVPQPFSWCPRQCSSSRHS